MSTAWRIVAIVLAALAILLLIGLGRPPSVSEATADVCADLRAYGRALADLRTVDESTMVVDLQESFNVVQDSWSDLQASVATLQEAQRAELETTHEALQESISSIPFDATLGQAQTGVRLAVLDAMVSVADTTSTSCRFTIPRGATTLPQR
jgi:hypothetical protein